MEREFFKLLNVDDSFLQRKRDVKWLTIRFEVDDFLSIFKPVKFSLNHYFILHLYMNCPIAFLYNVFLSASVCFYFQISCPNIHPFPSILLPAKPASSLLSLC